MSESAQRMVNDFAAQIFYEAGGSDWRSDLELGGQFVLTSLAIICGIIAAILALIIIYREWR